MRRPRWCWMWSTMGRQWMARRSRSCSSRSSPLLWGAPGWVCILHASCVLPTGRCWSIACSPMAGCVSVLCLGASMSLDAKAATGRNPRVLVVDDEPDILELLELALLRMGLDVERAANVDEALRKLGSGRYDLCLTDMRMPDGEGLDIVRHIAAHNLDVPVAVITAHGNLDNAVAVLKAGAFDYLSKPVSLDQLRALIKAALKLPQSSGELKD